MLRCWLASPHSEAGQLHRPPSQQPAPQRRTHLWHLLSVALAALKVPLEQAVQAVAPWPLTLTVMVPGAQAEQLAAPAAGAMNPGSHWLHSWEPVPAAKVPGALHGTGWRPSGRGAQQQSAGQLAS